MRDLDREAPELISTGVQAMIDNAQRLGFTWVLKPATVRFTNVSVGVQAQYDNDDTTITMFTMIGPLAVGDRVYVLEIPPAGNFIVGYAKAERASSDFITTQENTGSAAYTDLATVGPTVTRTIGPSGLALVVVTAFAFNGTLGAVNWMGYEMAGANVVAASDSRAMAIHSMVVNGQGRVSAMNLEEDLAAGETVFTAKYRTNAGSANYSNRSLIVIPY